MAELLEMLFVFFVIYILYKFIFELIVPVSKATSQVKSKIHEMHRMQQEQETRQHNFSKNNAAKAKPAPRPSAKSDTSTTDSEYIDFEEIK